MRAGALLENTNIIMTPVAFVKRFFLILSNFFHDGSAAIHVSEGQFTTALSSIQARRAYRAAGISCRKEYRAAGISSAQSAVERYAAAAARYICLRKYDILLRSAICLLAQTRSERAEKVRDE